MSSRSEFPGLVKKKKFIEVLEKNGFVISKKGGKGGSFKVTYKNEKAVTLLFSNLEKYQLYYILKEIENISGVT